MFSPYEDRFRHFRYDNIQKHYTNSVLPFHFNEERKLAENLSNLRERISKELSFKHVREFSHSPPAHERLHAIPISQYGMSKDIVIEELTQANQ
jgi:hypothetical protein